MQAGHIYTVAGNGLSGSAADGGPAGQAELWDPGALAVDASGDLFIADQGNRTIRVLTTQAGTFFGVTLGADDVGTVAGEGSYGPYLVDGLAGRRARRPRSTSRAGWPLTPMGNSTSPTADMQVIRWWPPAPPASGESPPSPDAMYTAAGACLGRARCATRPRGSRPG